MFALLIMMLIPLNIYTQASKTELAFDLKNRTETVPLDKKENFVKWRKQTSDEDEKMIAWRWDTAEVAITRKELTNQKALEAFLRTPREIFAGPANLKRAYEDNWLTLRHGVTISGPHMVTKMTNELKVEIDHKVLEIGTGSGYQSAMLCNLSNHVYTIEIIEPLAKETDELFKSLEAKYPEYKNNHRKNADGYFGWIEEAPFDRIIVTCGIDHIPPPLLEQLKPEGIMLIPVGSWGSQTMLKVTKHVAADGKITYDREDIYKGRIKVTFIPFTANGGKERHTIKRDQPEQ